MTAVTVGSRKLKITLSAKESSKLFFDSKPFSCLDNRARRLLKIILKEALENTDFCLDCDRLLVEIYPSALGGHIIYFTKSSMFKKYRHNPSPKLCFVLKFKNSANMTEFCNTVVSSSYKLPKESRLYKYNGCYYLIMLQPYKTVPFSLITEFADTLLCSETTSAIIHEYGKCIISKNAIGTLSKI